jgi:hypothetical protein
VDAVAVAAAPGGETPPEPASRSGENPEPPGHPPDLARVQDPIPYPTLGWLIPQLIPSPEVLAGTNGARAGLRWQVTPLLYSFGINRRLTPWRSLVADPLSRQSGSVELYFTPEYAAKGAGSGADFLARTGVRSYFGLVQHGDYLSVSLGASHFLYEGRSGAAVEAGAYVGSGLVGLQVTYSPTRTAEPGAEWIVTLRIRYF